MERDDCICFGRYALQVLEPTWFTARQIEVERMAMTQYACHGRKIWVYIFLTNPLSYNKTYKNTYGLGEWISQTYI